MLFQEAVKGQEKILGQEHAGTLDSKHWLGIALYMQQQ
jgi:hypothetical protein